MNELLEETVSLLKKAEEKFRDYNMSAPMQSRDRICNELGRRFHTANDIRAAVAGVEDLISGPVASPALFSGGARQARNQASGNVMSTSSGSTPSQA